MLKNHFKIAFRSLWFNKSYSIINILGLAIGMACFLVILLYVKGELGYDTHHEKGDQIYRMVLDRVYPGRHTEYAIIPHSYAVSVKTEFPEVEATTRLAKFPGTILIKRGETIFEEKERVWADSNFFEIFTIPFIIGNPDEALKKPNSVVLTASTAKKYFGKEDPMGKILDVPQTENDLLVTGICEDIPETSHFTFDLMMSTNALQFFKNPNHVGFSAYTYLVFPAMKKTIFYSILFLFSLQVNAQQDQTLFSGTKLEQSGSWAGFSYTPTEVAGKSSIQGGADVRLDYNNSIILGWQWRKTSDEIELQDGTLTDQLEFGYHTFLGGYVFRPHKVLHPIISVGVGPGKLEINGDKDRLLVVQPSVGVEINLFRWMRLGIDGGYRYVTGNQYDKLDNQDLSNYFGTVTFRFGWSWGR